MKHFCPIHLLPVSSLVAIAVLLSSCDQDKTAAKTTSAKTVIQTPTNSQPAVTTSPATAPEAPQPPAPPEPLVAEQAPSPAAPRAVTLTPSPIVAGSLAAPNTPTSSAGMDPWNEIKDFTYAQKSELVTRVEAMIAQLDTTVANLRGSSPKPEAADARSASLAALDSSRAVLIQKRDALQYASAETWQSSKTEFRSAWRGIATELEKLKATSN